MAAPDRWDALRARQLPAHRCPHPLNAKLEESAAAFWPTFLDEWVPVNHLRALLCTASFVLLVVASNAGHMWPIVAPREELLDREL